MVLTKAKKVTKNHKSTGINLSQATANKDGKKQTKLERSKWNGQKKVKSYTRREFTE
jgi:hypothetical protein